MRAIENPRYASYLRTLLQFIEDEVLIRSSAMRNPCTEFVINEINDGFGTKDDTELEDTTGVKAPDDVPTAIRGRR
jgi:hypothetical protein|tara:strand:+ start:470 stop:697 length:228 start_codon:yes stop_codon:yes gene_type:complete